MIPFILVSAPSESSSWEPDSLEAETSTRRVNAAVPHYVPGVAAGQGQVLVPTPRKLLHAIYEHNTCGCLRINVQHTYGVKLAEGARYLRIVFQSGRSRTWIALLPPRGACSRCGILGCSPPPARCEKLSSKFGVRVRRLFHLPQQI